MRRGRWTNFGGKIPEENFVGELLKKLTSTFKCFYFNYNISLFPIRHFDLTNICHSVQWINFIFSFVYLLKFFVTAEVEIDFPRNTIISFLTHFNRLKGTNMETLVSVRQTLSVLQLKIGFISGNYSFSQKKKRV